MYQNLRSNFTYVITCCVHVRNLHPGVNVHLVLICSTKFAPPGKVEQIRTRMHFARGCIFIIHRLHDQNTHQLQIYTYVYICTGVQIVHINEVLPFRSVGHGRQWISEDPNCVIFLFKFVT